MVYCQDQYKTKKEVAFIADQETIEWRKAFNPGLSLYIGEQKYAHRLIAHPINKIISESRTILLQM